MGYSFLWLATTTTKKKSNKKSAAGGEEPYQTEQNCSQIHMAIAATDHAIMCYISVPNTYKDKLTKEANQEEKITMSLNNGIVQFICENLINDKCNK